MKNLLKRVLIWLKKTGQTFISCVDVIISNKIGVARRVRSLSHDENVVATLLANGPSAKEIVKERRDLLLSTDLLAVNDFANTSTFFELKPKYYILLDPAYFNPKVQVESEKNATNYQSITNKIQENFKKVDWPMLLFMPSAHLTHDIINTYSYNGNIKVIPFNATRVLGFDSFQCYMYKRGQGVPSSRNVIIPAMILLVLMGYRKVYLYGCEFSWTKTMDVDLDNGMMFFNDRHFYSKDEIRYFGKGGYVWWLETIAEELRGTEKVAQFAKQMGVKIINRTKGSFIDAFDYENPDSIKANDN
jgi:hypothetical protein